jgi:hypothetical protein
MNTDNLLSEIRDIIAFARHQSAIIESDHVTITDEEAKTIIAYIDALRKQKRNEKK